MGTFNKIEFTSTFEDFYAFTVGVSDSAVPEPASMALVAAGLAFVALCIKRGSKDHVTTDTPGPAPLNEISFRYHL